MPETILDVRILLFLMTLAYFTSSKFRRAMLFPVSGLVLIALMPLDFGLLICFGMILYALRRFFGRYGLAVGAAIILLVDKLLIYQFGELFEVSGLSFFVLTMLVFLLYKSSLSESFRYSIFFPHVLAGPVILEKISNNQRGSQVVLSAGAVYCVGMILLEASSVLMVRYAELTVLNILNPLADGYFYLMSLYANFFGYSLIALSFAWLMGLNISYNFDAPGCSISPKVFWERWHISLSTFMRVYVYPFFRTYMNSKLAIALTLITSGVWHGFGIGYFLWSLYFVFLALLWPRSVTAVSPLYIRFLSGFLFTVISAPAWFLFSRGNEPIERLIMFGESWVYPVELLGLKVIAYLIITIVIYHLPIKYVFRLIGVVKWEAGVNILYANLSVYRILFIFIPVLLGFITSEGVGSVTTFIYERF